MTTISAKTILRSRHAQRPDKVLSTLLLRYPRCIHAEFMTHRVLSKNSASSRAIPVSKMIQDVMEDPFIPLYWGKNIPGMQAAEETDAILTIDRGPGLVLDYTREGAWLTARDNAIAVARAYSNAGYHKQIVNRLLEPFSHITVVASGTEWSNFRALREHPAAEPHIQILAKEIGRELDREDNIQTLELGEWHVPFVTTAEQAREAHSTGMDLIKLAVARCASTSYKTVDGFDMTLEKAIDLHDKLVGSTPLHASPAEHVAQADDWRGQPHEHYWQTPEEHGNFVGFRQYRKMLPNECL